MEEFRSEVGDWLGRRAGGGGEREEPAGCVCDAALVDEVA